MAKPRKQVSKPKKPDPDTGADAPQDTAADAPQDQVSAKDVKTPAKPRPNPAPKPATRADPKPEPVETPVVAPVKTTKSGGFTPALIGGILAAFLGFLAARSDILDPILPDALKGADIAGTVETLRASDTRLSGDLTALQAQVAAIVQPDLAPVNAQLTTIQTGFTTLKATSETQQAHLRDLEARVDALTTRIEDLEKRPMTEGASKAAIAAYDRELAALREAIAAQRTDVEGMIAKAQTSEADARELERIAANAARRAEIQATATRLHTALSNGAPYQQYLTDITDAGITVPTALSASASNGVASLAALRDAFPSAARAALSAARANQDDGGGITGFLQSHLGARSVKPRDGDDPDAILSRAEAALTDGRVQQALEELAALPDSARAQMQDWADSATTRLTALKAAEELAQSLISN